MATLAEYKRFLANEPESQIEYRTIQLDHDFFTQSYRFVSSKTDKSFTIEDDALFNGGEIVVFDAATMKFVEPAEREDSEQVLSVTFGNIDGRVHDIVDQIFSEGFFQPISAIYRKYYSGNTTEPAAPPLQLYASSLQFDGPTTVTFTAEDVNLSAKRSGILYTLEKFPGLAE